MRAVQTTGPVGRASKRKLRTTQPGPGRFGPGHSRNTTNCRSSLAEGQRRRLQYEREDTLRNTRFGQTLVPELRGSVRGELQQRELQTALAVLIALGRNVSEDFSG